MTINEEAAHMLSMWDGAFEWSGRLDTLDIARLMHLSEAYVYSVLNRAREARRLTENSKPA